MVKSSLPQTPTRRSKRFQPLVTPTHSRTTGPAAKNFRWASDVVFTRPTTQEDLYGEEELDDEDETKTEFHEAFSRLCGGKGRQRSETFRIGDTVLISTVSSTPSVGVIVSLWEIMREDEEERSNVDNMRVMIHWFLRPTELASIRACRHHLENEIYFSLCSTATLTPHEILRHCTISGIAPANAEAKSATAWSGSPRKSSRLKALIAGEEWKEEFFCNIAVDSRRGLFYELDWDAHHAEASDEALSQDAGKAWVVAVEETVKKGGRAKKEEVVSDDSGDEYHAVPNSEEEEEGDDDLPLAPSPEPDDVYVEEPRTPSKKRGRPKSTMTTPRKRPRQVKTLVAPTPHSKAALRARASRTKKQTLAVRPPQFSANSLDLQNLPQDPWLRAMSVLHVGARPDVLPCREAEYAKVLRSVDELVEEGSGGCVYISGVPGTGKTATVHAVVRELKRMAERSETNPFTYVEINGLKIPEPSAAYALLWEGVSGHNVAKEGRLVISSKEALKNLTKHFNAGVRAGPGGHACVVLMDELDQLVTAKQDVVYNFFNWPTLVGSKLIVIAVANTMDLPERVMSGRVRSRLGMMRINFQPYNKEQLQEIVNSRLLTALEGVQKKKNAAVETVISPDGIKFAAMKVSSISGDARRVLDICRRAVELVQPEKRAATTDDVAKVIKAMQNSPTAAYLRGCSLHERMMLAALVKCIKKDGVEEVKWGDVQHQHLICNASLTSGDDPTRKPTLDELSLVLDSLVSSRAMLIEDGAVASRKPEGDRRVVLNIEQGEVERVLGELGGQRWKSVLGV